MPGAQGPETVKGAQSDPNYVSRLLLDCVPVFHRIITPAYLLYRSGLRAGECLPEGSKNYSYATAGYKLVTSSKAVNRIRFRWWCLI